MALHSERHEHAWPLLQITDEPVPLRPEPVLNLRGDKVGLGPLRSELIPTYERWLNDFQLLAMLDRRFRPLTPDWIQVWYDRVSRGSGDTLIFTIWDIATTTPIGNTALQDIDLRSRAAEFGVFIAEPEFRNGGRGSEAVRLMLRFAFETLGLENVMLRAFAHNELAIRVYQRAGFRIIGARRGAHVYSGKRSDVMFMDMTRDDFDASQSQRADA